MGNIYEELNLTVEDLIEKVKANNPKTDIERIKKAYDFGKDSHKDQFRNSGEPYFTHPIEVAMILAGLNMDDDTIVAGLLHDVLEDTEVTFDEMAEIFGEDTTKLVDGVTKIGKIKYHTKQESQAENLRKMIVAMGEDIRVVIIKLADRLHNMRTLEYMSRTKQIEKAQETLRIYAPLANRLGISTLQWEMEDLCLRYLQPEDYYEIVRKINITKDNREKFIDSIIEVLSQAMSELSLPIELSGRSKTIYSIYKKMKDRGVEFEEIFDLFAVRIITNTKDQCYAALGAVHSLWKPIPGRMKDYIAVPKANMYQSLHTTVITNTGEIFEVQIRTHEMHYTAEYGIAAHWQYKEGGKEASNFDKSLNWVRQLMDWQEEVSDPREFMETFKEDFMLDDVYVFSPKGDVFDLPRGASPLDFAYRVHSAVGNHTVGAKVNGRIVPLNHELESGNVVEILTSSNATGPNMDWLDIVKSPSAKSKIRQFFKKEGRSENIVKGKSLLERTVAHEGYGFNEILKEKWLEKVTEEMAFQSVDDLYAALGYGSTRVTQVLPKLQELHQEYYQTEEPVETVSPRRQETRRSSGEGVVIEGVDNIQINIANCCNPVPGDPIVGYITRGHGVSVHRVDCPNALNAEPERKISVYWNEDGATKYRVHLRLVAYDRVGYLANVTNIVQEQDLNLLSVNAYTDDDHNFNVDLIVEIKSVDQIRELVSKIKGIEGTSDIYRVKS